MKTSHRKHGKLPENVGYSLRVKGKMIFFSNFDLFVPTGKFLISRMLYRSETFGMVQVISIVIIRLTVYCSTVKSEEVVEFN